MGLLDLLFGGGKKAGAPKAKPKKEKTTAVHNETAPADALTPEILAAISASVSMAMDDASPELVAAVAAAIIHAGGAARAVRFKRASNAWAAAGRQKVMDSRQFI